MRHRHRTTPSRESSRRLYDAIQRRDCTEVHAMVFKQDKHDRGKLIVSPAMMERLKKEGGTALYGSGLTDLPEPMPGLLGGFPVVVSNKLPFWSRKPTRREVNRRRHRNEKIMQREFQHFIDRIPPYKGPCLQTEKDYTFRVDEPFRIIKTWI